MTTTTECIRDIFESARCGKCKEIKKDIFTIFVNQKLVLCSECFEDFQWENVTEWDEDEGSYMGA
jgi:formylmethanofuran dehydrogenase subunit E